MTSESRSTGRGRRSSGWLATLLGGGLLVLLGFAAGMLVGASVEEPDLIASVMAGQADVVELPPEETIADRLGTAASEPPPPLGARSDVPPPVAAAPPAEERGAEVFGTASTTRPAGQRSVGPGFSIQVGAFREERPAQGLRRQLQGNGFEAYIAHSDEGSGQRWRVRVGPVRGRDEADRLAQRLKRDEGLPTWVVTDE